MRRIIASLFLFAATLGGIPATALAGDPGDVTAVVVTSEESGELATGATRQYTATAHYPGGVTEDVTLLATWTSSNPSSASIDSAGVALGNLRGDTFITAEYGVLSAPIFQRTSECTYLGTSGNDVFVGTPGADFICGMGGNDDLDGAGGNDVIEGGDGDDTLTGGDGLDRMYGQAGIDTLNGDADADSLVGGSEGDTLNGGLGHDYLAGQSGDDVLSGNEDNDRLAGGDDIDYLYGDSGNDRLFPGEGADVLVDGGIGRDIVDYGDVAGPVSVDLRAGGQVASGAGNDQLSEIEDANGSGADDIMQAAEAGSVLVGMGGLDTLYGEAGNDAFRGGADGDTIYGAGGADLAYGDGGDDMLYGDEGNDTLYGGADNDSIGGGADNDRVSGETGNDALNGGAGNDVLLPGVGTGQTVDGDDDVDTVSYERMAAAVTASLIGGTADHDIATPATVNDTLEELENLIGTPYDDSLQGDGGANSIDGLGGDDQMYGEAGNDRIDGGDGADPITGGDGVDTIFGGNQNDAIDGGGDGDVIHGGAGDEVAIDGGGGNDILLGQSGSDAISGGEGDDVINPGLGSETGIDGGDGTDTLLFTSETPTGVIVDLDAGTSTGGSGSDSFLSIENSGGTAHDDTIFGDENANRLSGGAGVDTITGRAGVDTIFGGAGGDFLRGSIGDVDTIDGQADTDTCGEAADTRISCELAFNEPPILTIVDNTNTFTEGEAAKAIDGTLTLTDDEANADSATVTIGSGFESGKDFLSTGILPAGVTANYVAPTLTITGSATVAQYEAILRGVKFENTSQDPSITDRTISFAVFDGEYTDSGNDVTMGVLRINDAPIADTDNYSGGNHGIRLRVGTTHADAHEVEVAGQVLDGDTDVDTPEANLTVTPGTLTSVDCAAANPSCANNVNMQSDGTFTYDPPAGGDTSDSFTYTVEDNDTGDSDGTEDTHTNTVTIGMSGTRAWFIDDGASASGRGVSHDPAQSLARLATGGDLNEEDGANDRILLYSGTYTNGIDLETGQKLLGEPHGLNIGGTQFVAAGGTKPAISSASGNIVTLHSGNEVQDLSLGNAPAASYSLHAPTGSGAFTVADTDIANTTGGALHIADGTPSVTLGTLSSTGSTNNGVRIAETEGGSVSSTGGTLSNATSADFATSNSGTTVTLGSAISDDNGALVSVSGGSGDVTYNGTITDGEDGDGDGIGITGTSGDHNFTKSVLLSTGNSNAMAMTNSASGSLRMVPTSGTNRATTTGGAALTVTDTPIASGGLSFEKISAVDPTIDATTYGIHLSNTGAAGSLVVAGVGGTCTAANNSGCSGGTIQGKSTGIKLNSTTSPSFTRMKLTNTGDFGIKGDTVTGFNMANTVIDGSVGRHGNDASADEGAVSFDELLGTGVTITDSVIKEGWENDLRVKNDSGTLNRLTVSGTTFGGSSTEHNDSVQLEGNGSGALNATVQNSTFTSARGDQLQASIQGVGAGDIVFNTNTVTNSHATSLGGGVVLGSAGSGDMTYSITGNNVTGAIGTAIVATATFSGGLGDSTAVGTISSNTIGASGVAGSGSTGGSGIDVSVIGDGRHSVQILNNVIRQQSQHAILALGGGASRSVTGLQHTGDLNVTATGNLADQPHNVGSSSSGLQFIMGTNSGAAANLPDQYDGCLNAQNNNFANAGEELSSNSRDYLIRQVFETFIRLPGYAGPQTGTTAAMSSALTTYLTGREIGAFSLVATQDAADYTAAVNDGYFNTPGGGPCSTT